MRLRSLRALLLSPSWLTGRSDASVPAEKPFFFLLCCLSASEHGSWGARLRSGDVVTEVAAERPDSGVTLPGRECEQGDGDGDGDGDGEAECDGELCRVRCNWAVSSKSDCGGGKSGHPPYLISCSDDGDSL